MATTIALGVGVLANIGVSLISSSSMNSVWSMINQFQLLLLLPLTQVYMSNAVVDYLVGMDFTMFSFRFLPISGIVNTTENELINFHIMQEKEYFSDIGLISQSTIINNISLTFMFLIIIVIHMIICAAFR
jgi:hypothetical protein